MSKQNNTGIGYNEEFGFLYKKTKYKANVISLFTHVPEYMEALRTYDGTLDDQSVYEIIKATYKQMVSDGKKSMVARKILNKVSRDLKGDSKAWQSDDT